MNEPKPIGNMHFAGSLQVPVYDKASQPETVYDVQEGLAKLKSMLADRKLVKKMSDEQWKAVVNQWAHFNVLAAFNVPTYPIIHDGEQSANSDQLEALNKLKESSR